MLIEQIIKVESRVPGLLVVHIPKTGYFHETKKNLRANDLMLKMLQKAMYLDSPDQAKSIGVARIFDWGGPKPSKIRLSSPKLRVNFGPKSEIRTIFPPKIR